MKTSPPKQGQLNIRVAKCEHEQWRRAAETAALPLAEWIRRQLNKASKK